MTEFFHALEARAQKLGSLLCVGLDPEPEALGAENCNKAGLLAFCKRIVLATSSVTLIYKPNSAFFERFVRTVSLYNHIFRRGQKEWTL